MAKELGVTGFPGLASEYSILLVLSVQEEGLPEGKCGFHAQNEREAQWEEQLISSHCIEKCFSNCVSESSRGPTEMLKQEGKR